MTTYLWHEPIEDLERVLARAAAGDEFHFDDGYASHRQAAHRLAELGRRGTFFLVTRWIGHEGFLSWDDVGELVRLGHELGNHTASHVWLGKVPPVARRLEIREAQDTLGAMVGVTPTSFAYPYGLIDAGAAAAVAEFGFELARGITEVVAKR
ncbi:MAG TPA: polysaccharide deacetylase family protein [Candidatus Limnocylindrales bacterium]|nr:polysaccharide deacetylase family protein [Candidatus Limnocylindrales bacterium]